MQNNEILLGCLPCGLLGILAVVGGVSHATAAVVNFDFAAPVVSSEGSYISIGSINPLVGTYDLTGTAPAINFSAGTGFMMGVSVWMAGDNSISIAKDSEGFIAKFNPNQSIGSDWNDWTEGFHNPPLVNSQSVGPWAGGGSGYVGLRLIDGGSTYYGWGAVTYNDVQISLSVMNIAFESASNTSISAGFTGEVIPEPSAYALLAGVGALAWAGGRRCRRA